MNNKTLLSMGDYPLIASPTLAKAYGMAAATFLQKLHYCLQKSDAIVHQKRRYWFHSYEQWTETLGFYSISTLKRVIRTLKQVGILLVEKLSAKKWLQTNYYSIDYQKLEQLFDFTTSLVKDAPTVQYPKSANGQPVQASSRAHSTSRINNAANRATTEPVEVNTRLLQGTPTPLASSTETTDLDSLPFEIKCFYLDLLRLKLDIHPLDSRIREWLPFSKTIQRHVVYIKEIAGGIERYRWHSPEQLGLERFTYQNQSSG